MTAPQDVFIHCDRLEDIPTLNRENWLKELELLAKILPKNARVLQVGSMDGTRAIHLLRTRPDLSITGLEIEPTFIDLAKKNVATARLNTAFVLGDITKPPPLPHFDCVICLNNTLGYIDAEKRAIAAMRSLGDQTIISVYGETFDEDAAHAYFDSIHLTIDHIEQDCFVMKDFGSIRRYTKKSIGKWGGSITKTPLGYFCVLPGNTR
jgi:SAM-dependent methyltransferase